VPIAVAIYCERERETFFFFLTAVQTLLQGRAMALDLYFIRLLDPGMKQWLLISWRNRIEPLGCPLFWDHTSVGTFYLMKSRNGTPFRSTLCVCAPNPSMLWGQICRKCPRNVVKSDKAHFGDVLKGTWISNIFIYTNTTIQKFVVCKNLHLLLLLLFKKYFH